MKSFLWILVGIVLFVLAFLIKDMTVEETRQGPPIEETKPGTETECAIGGAAVGAAVGGVAGALIGGVGVVACGTGFGIPVGLVCLGLATLCGGMGAAAGHIVGEPEQTVMRPAPVETVQVPAYADWVWIVIMLIAGYIITKVAFRKIKTICYVRKAAKEGKMIAVREGKLIEENVKSK